ncbi:Phage Terminase [Sporotomaculum syntrophicum]|uniref:Phage Terminase n=1 Tax=Sporotomaculum syntrophicum TaxID=182264 RepID=A0A9D2WP99_9FIRM|nr:terminase TerL endonuclease subunit [Sporotomaculum syntrophicum]KAF1084848.1 Phage Terminase [Sporotomaculum syntrophicum]
MFDEYSAERAVKFIENYLTHTKGKWAGVRFELEPWQHDIITPLFGTLNEDGTRQYRTCYVEIPRKNGKSELGAAVALKLLFADNEPGAEIYSAAADRDQAAIVFNTAAQMVRQNPKLAKRCKIIDSQKRIVIPATGSFYRAISADAHTKHGFNAHGIIFDELHTQPNRELWDVLTTSGGTRTQPLIFAITTAGYDRNSICWEQHEYAQKIIDGVIEDKTFLPVIYAAGKEDDWRDEKVWYKANPALSTFRGIEEMRAMAKKAEQVPALQNTFRRLYLNQWTQQEDRWLDLAAWDATAGTIEPDELLGKCCFGGLDLASTTDIAAFVLVFPMDDGGFVVLPHFWIPRDNMRERINRDRVPYDVWTRQGLITATEGNVIHYEAIRRHIEQLGQLYNIREIAFDRWGAVQITTELDDAGFTVVQFGQGFASMSPPTKELLNLVLSKKLVHGGNPVLRWMADNMVVKQDPAGNVKPDKSKSSEKIDGMVALIMALDRATRYQESESVYNKKELLVL